MVITCFSIPTNLFSYVKVCIFIHWDKSQMLKKFPPHKINCAQNAFFFLSSTHKNPIKTHSKMLSKLIIKNLSWLLLDWRKFCHYQSLESSSMWLNIVSIFFPLRLTRWFKSNFLKRGYGNSKKDESWQSASTWCCKKEAVTEVLSLGDYEWYF